MVENQRIYRGKAELPCMYHCERLTHANRYVFQGEPLKTMLESAGAEFTPGGNGRAAHTNEYSLIHTAETAHVLTHTAGLGSICEPVLLD